MFEQQLNLAGIEVEGRQPLPDGPNGEGAQAAPAPEPAGRAREAAHAEPPPPHPYPPGTPDVLDEPHLLDYVKALYRRRWTAVTVFLIVFLGVTVYTFTATPIYEATVRLLIESDTPNIVNFQQVLEEGQARTDYYQTQYDLLKSRSLARRTLDSQKLWAQPPFGAAEQESFSVRREVASAVAGVGAWVSAWFRSGEQAQPVPDEAPDETEVQSAATDRLLAGVQVSPVRNSRIVNLSFRATDPHLSARVVNAHARNYIEQNLEFKFLASKEATDWLGERLVEQRKAVEESEAAMQRYREQNDALSLEDTQNIVVQELSELNAAVTRAKTERIEKEALYSQLRGLETDRAALDTFPAVLANTFIQQQKSELATLQRQRAQLADRLGDEHPEMVKLASAIQTADARLQGEIAKVVQGVKNQFLAARSQEASLVAALDAQKDNALSLNRKEIEYGVLRRDVESNRQIYQSLLQRAKETGVSGELKTSNIRIVDAAEVPRAPVSPRKALNLLLGLFGGAMLAVGFAFFFEYLDNRIKSPEEIKTRLGLPFLGMIPVIRSPKMMPLLNNGVPASFGEAFRAVRTEMLFASADPGARSVLVTSTAPGEGKTTVACNLAIGFAQAGQRVLLIDADLRRPNVHEVFGQQAEPGLSNLLVGGAKPSETVRKSGVPGLWLLPAGRIPPNPADLLTSNRFKNFLVSLAEHFDWVLIDSPPVMAVTDASLVAHSASGVLFVVGCEMVSRHGAEAALDRLSASNRRFFGAVLNGVDLQRNAYYYSQYYKKAYSAYYTAPPA